MIGSVYFVECAGRIKIGHSINVPARLRGIATGAPAPLSLLATIEGSRDLELAIHHALKPHRERREWFTDCAEVRSLIATLSKDGGAAIGFAQRPPRSALPEPVDIWTPVLKRHEEIGEQYVSAGRIVAKSAGRKLTRLMDRGFEEFIRAMLEGEGETTPAELVLDKMEDRLAALLARVPHRPVAPTVKGRR